MIISEHGQITIPPTLRQKYGYLPHTEVDFEVKEDTLVLVKKALSTTSLEALYGVKKFEQNTNELMRLLRDE
ncbi:Transcriptional regulator AbrB [Beggiatoa sp. PS]|nr:Transcriptional regulator AbrB [Beggiatoa sp. PS]